MRLFALLLLLLQTPFIQSATNPAVPICTVVAQTMVSRSIQCDLRSAKPRTSFIFKVNFSGSHDDTRLTLEPLMNGKPLSCAPGSMIYSEGEDGDISLTCKFAITQDATTTTPLLRANFKWFHAEYVDHELAFDKQ
jgi:hypothetical protein